MKKYVALAVVGLLATSCAHVTYRNPGAKPISFTGNLGLEKKHSVVRHVDDDYRRQWLLFYLIPIGKDGTDMIRESVGDAEGLANLKITAVFDFWDVLFTNLTVGIYCTRSINIQGDLVTFKEGP